MIRLVGRSSIGVVVLLGALLGCLAALFLALSGEPPAEATVDELVDDPAIRASIEAEIVGAVDEEIELPLLDDELNTVVDLALSTDAGDTVVRDVVRAAVEQGFGDGPGVVRIELRAFVEELPGPLGLVEGLLDRQVEVRLPAVENPIADRVGRWVLGTMVALALALVVAAMTAELGSRLAALLKALGAGLLAAAIVCLFVPPAVGGAWARSSDFGQRLMREQFDAVGFDARKLSLLLAAAGVGSLVASRLSRPPRSAV